MGRKLSHHRQKKHSSPSPSSPHSGSHEGTERHGSDRSEGAEGEEGEEQHDEPPDNNEGIVPQDEGSHHALVDEPEVMAPGHSHSEAKPERSEQKEGSELAPSTFKVVVEKGVEALGFTPGSLPPSEMVISRVTPGGWAEENGVMVGDTFLEVNGMRTVDLTIKSLDDFMKRIRPLFLVFRRLEPEAPEPPPPLPPPPCQVSIEAPSPQATSEKEVSPQVVDGAEIWPEHWGITRSQCEDLLRRLRKDPAWNSSGSVYDLVDSVLVPETRGTGLGYALLQNQKEPKEANVLVSHAWGQKAEEFLEALCRSVSPDDVVYVSALAIYHAEDGRGPSLQAQLGPGPRQSPSNRVLQHITGPGRGNKSIVAWRWRELLESVPMVFILIGFYFAYIPIVVNGCVKSADGKKCAVRRLVATSSGDITALWEWSAKVGSPNTKTNLAFNWDLLVPAVCFVAAFAAVLVIRTLNIYRGRLLVIPNFREPVFSRLWCIYEVVAALDLGVPVTVGASLAVLGRFNLDTASCSKAEDLESLRGIMHLGDEDGCSNRAFIRLALKTLVQLRGYRMSWVFLRWMLFLLLVRSADLRLLSTTVPELEGLHGLSWFYPALLGAFAGVLVVGLVLWSMAYLDRAAISLVDFFAGIVLLLVAHVATISIFVLYGELRNETPSQWYVVFNLFTDGCFGYLRHGATASRGCTRHMQFWGAYGQTLGLGSVILATLAPSMMLARFLGKRGRTLQFVLPAVAVALLLTATAMEAQAADDGEFVFPNVVFWLTAILSRSLIPFLTIWRGWSFWGVRLSTSWTRRSPIVRDPSPKLESPRSEDADQP